ncbi:WGxxGxxG family protein [Paenibacillus alkaliterrae]
MLFSLVACMMLFSAIPAFADNMNRNNTPGAEMRNDVNRGITETNRALGTDFDHIDGRTNNRTNMNANNFRATTAADRGGIDWGWLGLLGLIGLAGMRNRDRERDRA